jgi:hypothetical protein
LFWEDLGHGLLFPHPSKLVLIDAASGRVAGRQNLTLYPLVDGRLPSFLRAARGYRSGAAAVLHGRPSAKPDLSKDGIVSIGQRDDVAFKSDFEAVDQLAKDLGVKKVDAKPSGEGLRAAIEAMAAAGKVDVLLFIGGHGYPEKDQYYVDENGRRQLRAPGSAKPKLTLEEKENSAEQLTSSQLAGILRRFPQLRFKVIVDSCYGGRFLDDLKRLNAADGPRNVAVAMSSANATEPTTVGFARAIGNGLRKWAAGAAAEAKLEDGLREAFEGAAVKRWAEQAMANGGSHPQVTPRPPPVEPPPPPPPCTSTLVRSPGTGSFTAANHVRVRATCDRAVRKVVVTSLSGDTFDACAQTKGTALGCSGDGQTLTTVWNQPPNQELEAFGRVAANADGRYRVQVLGDGDAVLLEYEANVPGG